MDNTILSRYLAMDAAPKKADSPPSLADHDKRFHPDGYKEGDKCKFREELAKGDEADFIAAEKAEAPASIKPFKIPESWEKTWNLRFSGDTKDDIEDWGTTIMDIASATGASRDMAKNDIFKLAESIRAGTHKTTFDILRYWDSRWKKAARDGAKVRPFFPPSGKWLRYDWEAFTSPASSYDRYAGDAAPMTNPLLEAHDRRFHPNGFDPSKDRCKLREELAKGDEADLIEAEAVEANSGSGSTPQDYAKVMEIRDRLEPIARLLNGRAGNIAALQSSSRWPKLRDYATKPVNIGGLNVPQAQHDCNFLDENILVSNINADPALKQVAKPIRDAIEAIIVSANSNWQTPAKMVPAASDIPAPSASAPTSAPAPMPAPVAPSPAPVSAAIDPDDAKAIILRAAKSINHHIDKGDFTPNAKALADVQAAKADISALNDPDLTRAISEIDASAQNGYKTRIGKVPLPSSAHSGGSSGGLPSGLLGALAAALGVSAPPKAKAIPGSVTAGPPFSDGPSPYENYLNSVNAGNPAINDPNAYKDAADALSETDARDILEGPGGFLVPGGYRDSIHPNDPDEKVLWSGWKPSQRLSPDTIRCAAVCFSDLRRRFPDMPWKNNLELRCGTKAFTGGQSTHTADDRRHTVLFNCDYGHIWPDTGLGNGAANYGHPDNRFPFDVLRHEMGHALMSGKLPDGRRMISKWHDAMTKAYGNPATDLEKFARKYVSKYAVTNKGNGFSMAECLSECFSLATSPDYQPGYLPRPVEDFIFGEMLGVKLS